MNILWLNWRDLKNPKAGGAEIMTQETAKRLVRDGHQVTLFTAQYPNGSSQELINGVKIIRKGNRLTCRFWAYLYYQKHLKGRIDLVIDEINTLPFFTPLYINERKIALIHQLAKEYWFCETFFPLNLIGYLLEPFYLKLYRNTQTICASNSTKTDMENLGFKKLFVFHQGLSLTPASNIPLKPQPAQILFIGRLTKTKGVMDALSAFQIIQGQIPQIKLNLCLRGKTEEINDLKYKIEKMQLNNSVNIYGHLTTPEKIKLLKRSQITLLPSTREGWCLVAIESSAFASIPVGYNVPGLCDSIKNNRTGLLTRQNNPEEMADLTTELLHNKQLIRKLSQNGLTWAKTFTWEKTYQSIINVISNIKTLRTISVRSDKNRTVDK